VRFVDAWQRFWFRPAPLARLAAFRMLVMALVFVELRAYAPALRNACRLAHSGAEGAHWNPIFLVSILGLRPIAPELAEQILLVGGVAALCGIVGLFSNASCAVAGLVLIYETALVYSFEKVHHDKFALAFTLLALPLAPIGARASLDAVLANLARAWRGADRVEAPTHSDLARFPLRCTQVSLAVGYGCAGLSKLVIAGPQWVNGYTLMSYLAEFDFPWSPLIAGGVMRMTLFSVVALATQLSFPGVLLWRPLAWFCLPAVVGNHVVNWMTMDTGPYASLWFLTVAFLPLERVPEWIRESLRSTSWPRRVLGVVAPLAPALLVGWLWFGHYLPGWSATLLLPIAATLLLRLTRTTPVELGFEPHSRASRVAAELVSAFDWAGRFELKPRARGAAPGSSSLLTIEIDSVARAATVRRIARELPLTAPVARLWPAPRATRTAK
jgi:hypothetical protein